MPAAGCELVIDPPVQPYGGFGFCLGVVLPSECAMGKCAVLKFVIPGREANPESRDSGSGPSDHPGMTAIFVALLLAMTGEERS
jgi:hypothetical protein